MLSDDVPLRDDTMAASGRFVPKWPFLLGDAFLVCAALVVWSTPDGLSFDQLLFCLGSVALGTVVFAAPYVLEKYPLSSWKGTPTNSKESNFGDSPAESASGWHRQARAAAEAVEHAVRANAALESSARRIDARFAPLVEVQQSLVAVAAELRAIAAERATAAEGETLAV